MHFVLRRARDLSPSILYSYKVHATQESRSNGILKSFLSPIALPGPKLTRRDELLCKGKLWTSHYALQLPEIFRTPDTVAIQISSFRALMG